MYRHHQVQDTTPPPCLFAVPGLPTNNRSSPRSGACQPECIRLCVWLATLDLQEMASRGLAAVYDMADEATRKALLDSLMATLSGALSWDMADIRYRVEWCSGLVGCPPARQVIGPSGCKLRNVKHRLSDARSIHRLPGGAPSLQAPPRSGGP